MSDGVARTASRACRGRPDAPPRVRAVISHGVDERCLVSERDGADYLLFIYQGGDEQHRSWSVDSRLVLDAQLDEVLAWLPSVLPNDSCWALGVVREPEHATTESHLRVSWIVGADLLNTSAGDRTAREQQIVDGMLARRHRVALI